jgi:import inner membrane translocase subunit TIM10
MQAAKTEMELFADLFNKMSDVCFKKCVGRMKESDLSVGEMSCADRCVGKYLGALEIVATCVSRVDGQMKQQAEAAQNVMNRFGGPGQQGGPSR